MLDILLTVPQDGDGQFTRDGREGFEEVIQREAVGEILKQGLHRHARALEDWRAAENFLVHRDEVVRIHVRSIAGPRRRAILCAEPPVWRDPA